jgi:SAM-dependent methyltransferase
MLAGVFSAVPREAFERCLEIGAGDGYLSTLLAPHARMLVSTEIQPRPSADAAPPNVRRVRCDAERLPVKEKTFDLIFSSHVLEHLPDLPGALGEMRRALRDDGVMVHLVPTRTWKLLDMGLFFPSQVIHVLERLTASGALAERTSGPGARSNVKTARPGWLRRSFWPPVHGVARSNVGELLRFGVRRWIREFERAGLDVLRVRRRLPLHSPYRFGFERTRRLLESLGASSTTGFVLAHAGRRPRAAEPFAADSPAPAR